MKQFRWLAVVFFVLVALLAFRCILGRDRALMATDSNIGLVARSMSIPASSFFGFFYDTPLHGKIEGRNPSIGNMLSYVMNAKSYNNFRFAIYLFGSSLGIVGFLRLRGISKTGALLGGLSAYWLGSMTLVAAGHAGKFSAGMLFAVSLWLMELLVQQKKLLQSGLLGAVVGGVAGGMLLEQQDMGLLFGLVLGAYALFRMSTVYGRSVKRWLVSIVPIVIVGLMVAAPTALSSYDKNVSQAASMQTGGEEKWNYITQWSFPPKETIDLVAPGFFGLKTGHAALPYWGACGQSAEWPETKQGMRNFKLDSIYVGAISVALAFVALVGVLRKRAAGDEWRPHVLFWFVTGVILLFLSYGKYSILYKAFYQLPLVNNIRAPIKFLHVLQVVVGILAALGWDILCKRVLSDGKRKVWSLSFVAVAVLFLVFGMIIFLGQQGFVTQLTESGWGNQADKICKGMYGALLYSGTLFAVLGTSLSACWLKPSLCSHGGYRFGLGALVLLLLLVDVGQLSGQYFESFDLKRLQNGNVAINTIKSRQGNERVFFFDSGHVYNQWLAMEVPYHQLNVFNVWQMPRMSADYKAYLSAVGGDWYKLLQMGSVRYVVAPAGMLAQLPKDTFEPILFYRFVRDRDAVGVQQISQPEHARDQVLLKFNASLNRFSLFFSWSVLDDGVVNEHLASKSFNPLTEVVISNIGELGNLPKEKGAAASCSPLNGRVNGIVAAVDVNTVSGGVLLFTQHYQQGWRVFIDGDEQPLLRCNSINMGVYVPAGKHTVLFKCPRNYGSLSIQLIGVAIAFGAGVYVVMRRRAL